MQIIEDDLSSAEMIALIRTHLTNLQELAPDSPPQSRHALSLDDLRRRDVTLWGAWHGPTLAGCVALKVLSARHGEIKSMRTATGFERQGIASLMLEHLICVAKERGLYRLSLETGSQPGFAPARAFYQRHGFKECQPFAEYVEDPNSVYMSLELADQQAIPAEPVT
ncbi:hypothetical protein AR456_18070 [Halomonas huangheensis]|nr:hypothetical protein AR456_18070 [Halomonas huangheensis]